MIYLCVLCFSTALGVSALGLPLRALEVGYGPATAGYLGGLTATCQIGARMALPWALRLAPDRRLIMLACLSMAGSAAALLSSRSLVALVLAALLLGLGRAVFWTVSQVHVLHGDLSSGQRVISRIQFLSALGELAGPVAAGMVIGRTVVPSLWLWLVFGLLSTVATLLLVHYPPERTPASGRAPVWKNPDVVLACAAASTTGGWRALMSSVVPAVLAELGRTAGQIGVLVGLGNAMSVAGALAAGSVRREWIYRVVYGAIALTGGGMAIAGLSARSTLLVGLGLALSGLGGGALQTLAPVLAAGAVHGVQRGDAMVLIGLARSVALLVLPTAAGAMTTLLAAPVAVAVGGVVLALPLLLWCKGNDPS